jgi:hypothetical protein
MCGYGSNWTKEQFDPSNLKKHMARLHGTSEVCVGTHFDPFAKRPNTWRVLDEAHPDLIVCIRGERDNKVNVLYCLDCNAIEQLKDERDVPYLRFPSHRCHKRTESKLKGTKRVKAAEPAVGGAGTAPAPAPPTRALVVPYDWLKAHRVDTEGNVLDNLAEELRVAALSWEFQKAAKAAATAAGDAMRQLAEAKAAKPVSGTVDLSTAAQMVADALCSDSKVGRIVRAEKAELEKEAAADLDLDPLDYEPYTPYRLLVEMACAMNSWRVACNQARDKTEAAEQTIQMRDGELARLKVENSRIIQNYTYCERDKAIAEERVRVLEKALAAAQKEQPTPPSHTE